MKKIEEYIETIYRSFDESDEETKVLKEETKVHLLEEVEELKKQGLTEEESISKAISNFGSEKVVISEMNQILKKQNKFSKGIKKLSVIIFIAAIIFQFVSIGYTFIRRNQSPYTPDMKITQYVVDTLANKIENKVLLDENTNNEITQLLDEFNLQTSNGLYYLKIEKKDNPSIYYEYKKDISEVSMHEGGTFTKNWKIIHKTTDKQTNHDYMIQNEVWNKIENNLPFLLRAVSFYLFVVAAVLLCVYIISKVYLKRSLIVNLR